MDTLLAQVRRARRRLVFEQYLRHLVWCLFAGLLVAAVAIAVPQVVVVESLPANWAAGCLLAAAIAAMLAAAVTTWLTGSTALEAAMEIDRRYALRERVASSLALAPHERETPAARALVTDAVRTVDRINIAEKFRPRIDRRGWLPLLPAVLAFGLITFGTNRQAESNSQQPPAEVARAQVDKATEEYQKKLAEKREQAKDQDLKTAEEMFKQLEEQTAKLRENGTADRKKATVELNNLAKQLEQRRAKLGASNELQKQMEQLKQLGQGPAEKMAKAVKEGDWQRALAEVQSLQEKLAGDQLTAEQKQQLAKQLQQMQDKLAEAAQANQEAMERLKQQIEEQRQQGNLAKAGELQQKLDQLQQNQPQMEALEQLAEQLGQCQQCMANGDQQGAAQAMAQLAEQLDGMQQELAEMEMMDEALAQLEMAKNAMGCQQCGGAGCQACGGNQFANQQGPGQGDGMGTGRGANPPPDEQMDTDLRDSQVRQRPAQGAATFGGFVDGPNLKGQTAATLEEELATIQSQPADPLTSQRLPRPHGEHAEQYFEQLREP